MRQWGVLLGGSSIEPGAHFSNRLCFKSVSERLASEMTRVTPAPPGSSMTAAERRVPPVMVVAR